MQERKAPTGELAHWQRGQHGHEGHGQTATEAESVRRKTPGEAKLHSELRSQDVMLLSDGLFCWVITGIVMMEEVLLGRSLKGSLGRGKKEQ